MTLDSPEKILKLSYVADACSRKLLSIEDGRIKYNVHALVSRSWKNPEGWIRAHVVAWLVVERGWGGRWSCACCITIPPALCPARRTAA